MSSKIRISPGLMQFPPCPHNCTFTFFGLQFPQSLVEVLIPYAGSSNTFFEAHDIMYVKRFATLKRLWTCLLVGPFIHFMIFFVIYHV